jgi:hypothetical protein
LLCTSLIHEYSVRKLGKVAMLTQHPSLFENNSDVSRVVEVGPHEINEYSFAFLRIFGKTVIQPHYTERNWVEDRDQSPAEHIIASMCRKASISGTIALRPYLHLTQREIEKGRIHDRQIIIQTTGAGALLPMRNKEWFQDRFQVVVDALKQNFQIIQVGNQSDPVLQNVTDLRGKTTFRQAAALLANSTVFVGLVGFLMHLARAVDCRSVIIYGGREKPWQSGYSCNINLTGDTPCAPCWRWNTCDYDHECMRLISPDQVIEAVFSQAARRDLPIEFDNAWL